VRIRRAHWVCGLGMRIGYAHWVCALGMRIRRAHQACALSMRTPHACAPRFTDALRWPITHQWYGGRVFGASTRQRQQNSGNVRFNVNKNWCLKAYCTIQNLLLFALSPDAYYLKLSQPVTNAPANVKAQQVQAPRHSAFKCLVGRHAPGPTPPARYRPGARAARRTGQWPRATAPGCAHRRPGSSGVA